MPAGSDATFRATRRIISWDARLSGRCRDEGRREEEEEEVVVAVVVVVGDVRGGSHEKKDKGQQIQQRQCFVF
jgi:hypothetical protein